MSAVSTVIVSPIRTSKVSVVGETVTVVSVIGGPARVTEAYVGMPGPTGPSGGASSTLRHSQIGASASWTIPHGLGYFPNVQTFDEDDIQMFAAVTHPDINTVQIDFPFALSGYAILS